MHTPIKNNKIMPKASKKTTKVTPNKEKPSMPKKVTPEKR
jgi:hypothetical protein